MRTKAAAALPHFDPSGEVEDYEDLGEYLESGEDGIENEFENETQFPDGQGNVMSTPIPRFLNPKKMREPTSKARVNRSQPPVKATKQPGRMQNGKAGKVGGMPMTIGKASSET